MEGAARGSCGDHWDDANVLRHRAGILLVDILRGEIHINQIYSCRFDLLSAAGRYVESPL